MRLPIFKMPAKGPRYMNKVDLDKDAGSEPFLHVSFYFPNSTCNRMDFDLAHRTDGTQTVRLHPFK